jgi:hypothetical protein
MPDTASVNNVTASDNAIVALKLLRYRISVKTAKYADQPSLPLPPMTTSWANGSRKKAANKIATGVISAAS